VLWQTVQRAVIGEIPVDEALSRMRGQIRQIVQE
jgi:hypothetical protein